MAEVEPRPAGEGSLFISYSRRDQANVRRLCEALAGLDRAVWVDWEGIAPSAEWLAEIEQGIRSALAVVFVISPDSVQSQVCRKELELAVGLNKRLLPVVVRDPGDTPVPPELARLNWIFMRDSDDFDAALQALLAGAEADLDWLRQHTALLVPALAWQDAAGERSRLLKGHILQQAESWLAGSAGKAPPAARVQIDFIQASRRAATRRLRIALGGTLVGIVGLLALTVWALLAETRADFARADAEARRIGADAGLVASERANLIETSALLAIESWRRRPSLGNDVPLRRALRLLPMPVSGWAERPGIADAGFVDGGETVAYATGNQLVLRRVDDSGSVRRLDHESRVDQIAACPASARFATLTTNRQAALWRLDSEIPLKRLPRATAMACSSDGQWLAIGDPAGRISVHRTDDGSLLRMLPKSVNGAVEQIRFSADGRLLAASSGPRLRVWLWADAEPITAVKPCRLIRQCTSTGDCTAVRQCHPIVDIDFAPDNSRVMVASASSAFLWSLPDNRPLKRIDQATNVHRARFAPKGGHLALAVGDGRVRVFKSANFAFHTEMRHQAPVHHLRFSADGRFVLSASNDGTARLWWLFDGSEQLRQAHGDFVSAVDISADGASLLSASRDGRVRVWQSTIPGRRMLDGPRLAVALRGDFNGTRFAADAGSLFESQGKQRWRLYSPDASITPLEIVESAGISHYVLSPDRQFLAAARFDGKLDLRHLPDGVVVRQIDLGKAADTIGFSPDGSQLLTGTRDGLVRLWSIADGRLLWAKAHARFIFAHAFSADGRLVASGASDHMARVWQVDDGVELHALKHGHDVRGLDFHPDGKMLASASSDKMARLWRLDSGKVERFFEHQAPVLTIAFDAKGTTVATGASDNSARLWDVVSGRERARIETPSAIQALGFAADSRLRLYSGTEWAVHETSQQALVDLACDRLTRNLDLIAWLRYVGKEPPRSTCPDLPPPGP